MVPDGPFCILSDSVAATSLLADLTGLDITRMMGSWDMLFFIYGYLVISNVRIRETIERLHPVAFVMGLLLTLGSQIGAIPSRT